MWRTGSETGASRPTRCAADTPTCAVPRARRRSRARGAPSPPIASPWNARSRRCGTRAFAATRRGALLPDRQLGRGGGLGYVVLLLGGSAATLGLIGFLNTIPNLIFGLPAGALADRYDRRKLLLIFQGANMVIAVVLAVPWATDSLSVRSWAPSR